MISIRHLVNNERVCDVMFNLYLRWLDEWQYEDINEYGVVLANVIGAEYKGCDVVLLKCESKPFAFTFSIDNEKVRLFIKEQGDNVIICGQ